MKIIVIIPTYNESGAIGGLIDVLEAEFKNIKNHEMEILIVDGNSTDGTADIVRSMSKDNSNIHLYLEKEKRGLGLAYIEGIRYAVEKLGAGAFIEFDGDFQHDPKDIRRLVAELDSGYDYVIGSRYVAGGEIPSRWGLHRKIMSRFGSLFAKIILALPTNDNTSGFKLTRVSGFYDSLPLSADKILSLRHAYKIHLLYEMHRNGAKIKEVPIRFLERDGGESKSSIEDIFESLRVVLALLYRKILIKFNKKYK